ncbi:MAG: hypothetical protein GC171_10400 [Terrimonas sp.]|nr:hypothetical protein [Terrimonas sp.]
MFFLMMVSFAIHPGSTYPEKLSDWGIFKGKLADLNPEEGVVPYGLNTPLYTDYAEKLRFIKLPKGSSVNYVAEGMPDFPVGTILVKTFYYSADFRKPGINKQIIETRLLVKEASAWKALTYIWNAEQTDADWEVAGDEKQVAFIDKEGVSQSVRYVIPNQNQCKGCHNRDDRLSPIGPSVSQLNGDYVYASGKKNQLKYWKRKGMMLQVPKISSIPRTAVWNDPASGDLNARARAYLAINCAHCHSKTGPAQSSGLFLTEHEKDSTALGFLKTPVAAGKGSGGRSFDILPGDAESSIIWYRMQTRNPGERMPELGRNLVHKEGLALIREWINTMKKQ